MVAELNIIWIENARKAFQTVYGEEKGRAVCGAVIPGVMGDFRKMLEKAPAGAPVAEDYRTDDGKTDIHIEGRREADGLRITALSVGGSAVDLGGEVRI